MYDVGVESLIFSFQIFLVICGCCVMFYLAVVEIKAVLKLWKQYRREKAMKKQIADLNNYYKNLMVFGLHVSKEGKDVTKEYMEKEL